MYLLLDDVDVVIELGECVCIVGCNGVGKLILFKVFDG